MKYLRKSFVFILAFTILGTPIAKAQGEISFSSDEYETNLKTRVTHAKGNVKVVLQERTLKSDLVDYFPGKSLVKAQGKVVLSEGAYSIEAREARVSTLHSTGVFFDAILRSTSGIYVSGSKIESLGDNKFRIVNGKMTFCQDCPQAWSVFGSSIEMELEGYAEINHALFQIKDQPVAYFPIFYFPVKVKRQSGFLLPRYRYSDDVGGQVGIPYFWAIAQDQDATIEHSYMTKGGHRVGVEHRYRYSGRSFAKTTASYNKNHIAENVEDHRYGLSVAQRWQINKHWVQRYVGELASDPRYTSSFDSDFRDFRMPALTNQFSLARQDENSVVWVQGIAHRNNLIRDESNNQSLGAIHLLPEIYASYPSTKLWGKIRASSSLSRLSFRRSGGPLDPGTGWIREGDRTSAQLRVFTPYYLFNVLLAETVVEARGDYYQFSDFANVNDAYRARIRLEEKISTELSGVYKVDWGELQALKHTVSPTITWGYSPDDWNNTHKFFSDPQVVNGTRISSPKFDVFDPRGESELSELSTSEAERRLRAHHLASWGVGTRVLGRFNRADGRRDYEELFGASISQDIDLETRVGKSLNISAFGSYNGYRLSTELAINPSTGDANLRNEFIVKKPKYDATLVQSIRKDLEQYGGNVVLRFFNPWSISVAASYDALGKSFIEEHYGLRYESSKAKCWFFSFDVGRKPNPDRPGETRVSYWPKIGFVYKDLL